MTRSLAALSGALGRILLAVGLAAAAVPALAEEDLPSRAGRLADVAGRVYLATEERAEDWVEALRNYTITSGDNLWVAGDGRAEIDYGGGQLRLAGDTNVHVARLDDRILALFVAQGRVIVRVRVLDPGESALIDTPNTQVTLTRPGLYRIEVAQDRSRTDVVVRQGEALVQLAAGAQQVLPGQTAAVLGAEATVRRRAHRLLGRWFRHVERRARSPLRAQPQHELRVAADGGLRGPRRVRRLADHSRVRRGVVPDDGRRGLGPVSLRPLVVGRRLGLDLGRRRTVGLRALPLREVGLYRRALGLDPGRLRRAPGLVAGDGGVVRRRRVVVLGVVRRAGVRLGSARLGRAATCRGGAGVRIAAGRCTTGRTRSTTPSVRARRRRTTGTGRHPVASRRSPARRSPVASRCTAISST